MKKTLTVNLKGIVFNIDEDAYQLLDNYLSNLRIHFNREEGTEEIMSDFEARISELFNERVRLGINVITIEEVEEVIGRMGKPEDLFDAENTNESRHEKTSIFGTANDSTSEKSQKRLMRDPDDKILGGVASGIAAYFGLDVTLLRLAMIILLFLLSVFPVVLAYLIAWLVIPMAKTAADKLIMRGERVNLENIGKTVTDGFDKFSQNMKNQMSSDASSRTTIQKIADFIVSFFGIILKIGAILLAIFLAPIFLLIVFVLFIVIIALASGAWHTLFDRFSWLGTDMQFMTGIPDYITALLSVGGILVLGIPLVILFYELFKRPLNLNPFSSIAKWVLFIIWLVSFLTLGILGIWSIKEYGTFYFQTINQTASLYPFWNEPANLLVLF